MQETTATFAPCPARLSIGVTGHRERNTALARNREAVTEGLRDLFARCGAIVGESEGADTAISFHSLMVDGVDQIAADLALERGWDLVAPLPFGERLNLAINAAPKTPADAEALLAGTPPADAEVEARAARIRRVCGAARLFQLADRDDALARLYRDMLADPESGAAREFDALCSDQVAVAARVMIERIDLLVAVWDGKSTILKGGTGHTVIEALRSGTPVIAIDPAVPDRWSIYTRQEEIALPAGPDEELLRSIVVAALGSEEEIPRRFMDERWHPRSSPVWGFYRRLEAVFGGEGRPLRSLSSEYERPESIAGGSGRALLAATRDLPGGDPDMADRIASCVLSRFAWSDGISSWLSDAYRSGMSYNFVLSALAVIVGAAYLPFHLGEQKWVFASIELLLLLSIVAITILGARRDWHRRWFETRRVAEYLRHGPISLLLGVARPPARWPRGKGSAWPESFARNCLRAVGLPAVKVDAVYLRALLESVIAPHVRGQRAYHEAKAARLSTVDHRLDRIAEALFILAIISVALYLLLKAGSVAGVVPKAWPGTTSMIFTFLGIAFPTMGASIAGIRFFADFQRFSAISQVTAEKLGGVETRMDLLLASPPEALEYAGVAALVHELDDIVVDEIESWQAVFGGKHIALPA